ncbi:MAG: MmgE/PrpD family protein [Chloroflexota bacterium]
MNPIDFIHDLTWETLSPEVRNQAQRCFLDTIGTAIGGRQTDLSRIIYDYAAMAHGGQGANLWFDGREVSLPGAVLAHGMAIDSLDMHDSCRPVKGHAGVALVPTTLATLSLSDTPISGEEFMTTLVMGYEISIRAGKALHATACDYHTSGAWSALGCAAITSRRLGLDTDQTRHALGIAEYHGPRSQMMRCIDYPTMLKDGSGWGAMAGVSAGLLAKSGFTGAPAITVEADDVVETWADLGQSWDIMIQYFKPYAVCYWAQPAVAGAVNLRKTHNIQPDDIEHIRVYTFHEASRLASRYPDNTEEAQYSLPFPLASALVHQELGYEQLNGTALQDSVVLDLVGRVELIDDDSFNARFPADRLSRVEIDLKDGRTVDSGEVRPLWDLTAPPTDEELQEKFHQLARALPSKRAKALEQMIWDFASIDDAASLLALLVDP